MNLVCKLFLMIAVISITAESHWDSNNYACPYQRDFWYRGLVISKFWSDDLNNCCFRCQNNARCSSYSYKRGLCYLVEFSSVKVYDYGWKTGLIRNQTIIPSPPVIVTVTPVTTTTATTTETPTITATATTTETPTITATATTTTSTISATTKSYGCFIESDFNYIGNDIGSLIVPNVGECCNACGTSLNCVVFSYSILNGTCSLKNDIPSIDQRVPATLVFSGIVTLK